jgi:hypothetical protein
VQAEALQAQEADRHCGQFEEKHKAQTQFRQIPEGESRQESQSDDQRRQRHRGLQRCVAQYQLAVLHEEEEESEGGQEQHRDRRGASREFGIAKQADFEQRMTAPAFDEAENRCQRDSGRDADADHRITPAPAGCLDGTEDEAQYRGSDQSRTGPVDGWRFSSKPDPSIPSTAPDPATPPKSQQLWHAGLLSTLQSTATGWTA